MQISDPPPLLKVVLLVGIVGVLGVAGLSVSITHTASSNADVFDTVVILEKIFFLNTITCKKVPSWVSTIFLHLRLRIASIV